MKCLLFIGCVVFFNRFLNILGCTKPSFGNVTVQSDFNLSKFLGIWYEIKWLPSEVHQESDIWHNFHQSFQLDNTSKQRLVVPGKARLLNNKTCFSFGTWSIIANNSAKMILEKKDINSTEILNWPYYVTKTDYEHYALIYSCASENYTYTDPCEQPVLWLFSRNVSLSANYSSELDKYMQDKLCVNLTQLEITPHDGVSCYSLSSSSNICDINLILLIFLFLLYI